MHLQAPEKETARDDSKGVLTKKRSRRRFLGGVGAAGSLAALAALKPGAAGAAGPASDTVTLRRVHLARARTERAGSAPIADVDPPSPSMAMSMPDGAHPNGATPLPSAVPLAPRQDPVIRMQVELRKAMEKPMAQRRWGMVIDTQRCIGCSACTIACKAENHLPPGVVYRPVIEEEIGTYPNVSLRFIPRPCQQCDDPPCVKVCPVGATWKREDGVVVVDYEACIGCRYCMTACPYGARYFDFGDNYSDGTPAVQPYEVSFSPEYGKAWDRSEDGSPVGNVRKCTFCSHRLEAGMLPACVTTCIGNATVFGDLNDPDAMVSELIGSARVMRLKEDLGTNPKVYYLT